MYISSHILGRKLRLGLLLLLLASQGIVNAHELGYRHSLDSHHCSICLVGHGLGAAVSTHPGVPQVQIEHATVPSHSNGDLRISHHNYYFTRAPPQSLRKTQSPI